jgi:hypothetical protein
MTKDSRVRLRLNSLVGVLAFAATSNFDVIIIIEAKMT